MKRVWIILTAVAISLFLLLPSLIPEGSSLHKFLPGKKINLGLDLRGGIHVVLGVEIQKALDVELDKLSANLEERLNEKAVLGTSFKRDIAEQAVTVVAKSAPERETVEKIIREDYFQLLTVVERAGNSLRIQLDPAHSEQIATDSLEQARDIIRNRVDEFGVAEPIIQKQGTDRILVQLPGVQDPDRALQLIGRTALLEFKLVEDRDPLELDQLVAQVRDQAGFKNNFTKADLDRLNTALKGKIPENTFVSFEKMTDPRSREVSIRPYLLKAQTVLTGQALEDARVSADQQTQKPQVSLRFSKLGAETFEKVTETNVGKQLAILLDGIVVSAPVIREKIPAISAGATISLGQGNRQQMSQEARDLALVLRSGALPAPVEILENRTVGASLGEDSIRSGTMAGLVGAIIVILFMMLYYRWSGFLANISLIINMLMLLAVMALFQATLTLPGIAGIVLTIGMAVDANVIIIERIRDELRAGRKIRAAIEMGYENAHSALFDSNLTTIIAGIVLYNFGTGPIRGFAVTLIVGLLCSYIAAVWFSRWIYEWYLDRYPVTKLSV